MLLKNFLKKNCPNVLNVTDWDVNDGTLFSLTGATNFCCNGDHDKVINIFSQAMVENNLIKDMLGEFEDWEWDEEY